ncbi:MFS transporter [Actinocrinis puniceicyclus]|uniref:MFS transporter n=1 Tax=Actinocrinis puniceicyclus TaxID=977794 RepID=A0A8J7WLN6_9ACTN|nr:MFS transporter [Actinocrinis puniceicyclus]MBS2962397.1 MFS transporter [Actinocrinis puniceicyclus]
MTGESVRTGRIGRAGRAWLAEMAPDSALARRFAALAMAQSLGFGVFLTSGAIFFTRTIGLTSTQVGAGLSAAGVFGLVFTVPIGRAADRLGARIPLLLSYAALAVLFCVYCVVRNFEGFIIVASLISVAETNSNPLRMTLTRACFPKSEHVRIGSQMRGLFNVGFMLGAVIAGGALAVGTRAAFEAVVLFTAATQLLCALITWRLRAPKHVRTQHAAGAKPRSGLRDLRFVGVSLLSGILELYQPILTVGLPLWIVLRTHAPASLNALLLVVDTALVFILQVAAGRGAQTPSGAARLLRRSGVLLAVCCLVFAATEHQHSAIAVPLLLVGGVILVLGEISQAAGSFGVSFHLPPPGRQGEYQGVFALGRGLQQTAGPYLVTALAVGLGRVGWLILAAIFLAVGFACVPLTASAERATSMLLEGQSAGASV